MSNNIAQFKLVPHTCPVKGHTFRIQEHGECPFCGATGIDWQARAQAAEAEAARYRAALEELLHIASCAVEALEYNDKNYCPSVSASAEVWSFVNGYDEGAEPDKGIEAIIHRTAELLRERIDD